MFGNRRFMQTIARAVLAVFVYSVVLYEPLLGATSIAMNAQSLSKLTSKIDELHIPYRLGRISSGFDAEAARGTKHGGRHGSLVIHIQDLHCHPEVQRNIADIIGLFDKKYGVARVFVEGAPEGKVNTDIISSIPDDDVRKRTLENLLKKGLLSGAEYYSVSNSRDFLYGIENWGVYTSNFSRVRTLLAGQRAYTAMAESLNRNIDGIRGRYLSSKVKRLETYLTASSRGREREKHYLRLEKLDRKYDVGLALYPNLSQYIALVKLDRHMKKPVLMHELKRYHEQLRQTLPYGIYRELSDKLRNERTEEYYLALSEVAQEYTRDLSSRYPELAKLLEYIRLNYSINPVQLVAEEQVYQRNLLQKYAGRVLDREVLFLSEMGRQFENFLALKITPDEYGYFAGNIAAFKDMLVKYLEEEQISEVLSFLDENSDSFKFYAANLDRNRIFCESIRRGIAAENGRKHAADSEAGGAGPGAPEALRGPSSGYSAVLENLPDYRNIYIVVTGGFHADVPEMLKASGVSYLAVTPNTTQPFDESIYNRFITDTVTIRDLARAAFAPLLSALVESGLTPSLKQATLAEIVRGYLAGPYAMGKVDRINAWLDEKFPGSKVETSAMQDGTCRITVISGAYSSEFIVDEKTNEIKINSHVPGTAGAGMAQGASELERALQLALEDLFSVYAGLTEALCERNVDKAAEYLVSCSLGNKEARLLSEYLSEAVAARGRGRAERTSSGESFDEHDRRLAAVLLKSALDPSSVLDERRRALYELIALYQTKPSQFSKYWDEMKRTDGLRELVVSSEERGIAERIFNNVLSRVESFDRAVEDVMSRAHEQARAWSQRASKNPVPRVLMAIAGPTMNCGSGAVVEALGREHQRAGGSIALSVAYWKPVLPADARLDDNALVDTLLFGRNGMADSRISIPTYSGGMPYNPLRYKDMTLIERIEFLEVYHERLRQLIEEYQPDIIHTNHLFLLNPVVQLIAPWIPVVATTHGTEQKMLEEDGSMTPLVAPAARRLDKILSISESVSDETKRIYGVEDHDITLVGNGFDRKLFAPKRIDRAALLQKYGISGEYDRIVLYVGRLIQWKGIDYLIESARQYSNTPGKKVLTLLVGSVSDELLGKYNARIAELGLQDSIKLVHTWVSKEEVADFMNAADVFVLPSVREPFSLVVLEALACGCRIVAANSGGPKILVKQELVREDKAALIEPIKIDEKGQVVEEDIPGYVDRLADGIRSQFDGASSFHDRLAISRSVKEYAWSRIYRKVLTLYTDVIRKRIERYSPALRPAVLPRLSRQVKVIEVHPTNRCNLDCFGCPYGHLHKDGATLPFETVDKIAAMGPDHVFVLGGGEPSVYAYQGLTITDFIRRLRTLLPDAVISLCTNGVRLMDRQLQKDVDILRVSTHGLEAEHFRGKKMPDHVARIWKNIWRYFRGPVKELWVTFLFTAGDALDAIVFARELWKKWDAELNKDPDLKSKRLGFKLLYLADDSRPADPFHMANPDDVLSRVWTDTINAIKDSDEPFGRYLRSYRDGADGFILPKEISDAVLPIRKPIKYENCSLAREHVIIGADGNVYPCRILCAAEGSSYGCASNISLDRLAVLRAKMYNLPFPGCSQGCRLPYTLIGGRVGSPDSEYPAVPKAERKAQHVHLLIFDVGNTIYTQEDFNQHQIATSLQIIAEKAAVSVNEVISHFRKGMSFKDVVEYYGQNIAEHFAEKVRRVDVSRLMPNARLRPLLERLSRNYHLAIVTNNGERMARRILNVLGVDDLFEYIIGSDRVGMNKPDTTMFEAAINYFALTPDQAVSIGDRKEGDIDSAASFGMNGILVSGFPDMHDNIEGKLAELESNIASARPSPAPVLPDRPEPILDEVKQDSSLDQNPLERVQGLIHNAGVYGNMSTGKWLAFPERAALVAQGRFHDVMPVNAQFVPSALCPSNCLTCTYGASKDEMRAERASGAFDRSRYLMSLEDMKLYIDRLSEAGVQSITFTGGGDPLFNPHLADGIEYASRVKNLATCLFNEAHLLTDAVAERLVNVGLRFIRISFNAGRPITYKHFFGVSEKTFYNALNGIEKLAAAKERFGKKLGLGVGVIIAPLNLAELMEIARLIQGIADRHPGTIDHIWYRPTVRYARGVQLTNPMTERALEYIRNHPDLKVYYEAYRRFVYEGQQFPAWIFEKAMEELKNRIKPYFEQRVNGLRIFYPEARIEAMDQIEKGFTECRACPWLTFIGPDGSVYHCVEHGLDRRTIYGNLKDNTLQEIWRGEQRKKVIDLMRNSGLDLLCPPMCMLTEQNRIFEVVSQALENPDNVPAVESAISTESRRFVDEFASNKGDAVKFMSVVPLFALDMFADYLMQDPMLGAGLALASLAGVTYALVRLFRLFKSVRSKQPDARDSGDTLSAPVGPRSPVRFTILSLFHNRFVNYAESLGPSLLKSYLEHTFGDEVDVNIIDLQFKRNVDQVLQQLAQDPPGIIGLSAKVLTGEQMMEILKKRNSYPAFRGKGTLFVCGNITASTIYREIISEHKDVLVTVGEAEDACVDLVLHKKGQLGLDRISNTAYWNTSTESVVLNPARLEADFARLPAPDRENAAESIKRGGMVFVEFSRGCSWGRCSICSLWACQHKEWRHKSVDQLVEELDTLQALGAKHFEFTDSDFFGPNPRTVEDLKPFQEFALKKIASGNTMTFFVYIRVQSVYCDRDSEEMRAEKIKTLKLLKQAGLKKVIVGVDAGSDAQRKRFIKGSNKHEGQEAVRILSREVGIEKVVAGMIIFDPFMSFDELREDLAYIRDAGLAKYIDFPFTRLTLYEGIPLTRLANMQGILGEERTIMLAYPAAVYRDQRVGRLARIFDTWHQENKPLLFGIREIMREQAADAATLNRIHAIFEDLRKQYYSLLDDMASSCEKHGEAGIEDAVIEHLLLRARHTRDLMEALEPCRSNPICERIYVQAVEAHHSDRLMAQVLRDSSRQKYLDWNEYRLSLAADDMLSRETIETVLRKALVRVSQLISWRNPRLHVPKPQSEIVRGEVMHRLDRLSEDVAVLIGSQDKSAVKDYLRGFTETEDGMKLLWALNRRLSDLSDKRPVALLRQLELESAVRYLLVLSWEIECGNTDLLFVDRYDGQSFKDIHGLNRAIDFCFGEMNVNRRSSIQAKKLFMSVQINEFNIDDMPRVDDDGDQANFVAAFDRNGQLTSRDMTVPEMDRLELHKGAFNPVQKYQMTGLLTKTMPDVKGKDVLDVGCGVGILGILSALRGADKAVLVDINRKACELASKNAEAYKVSEQTDVRLVPGNYYGRFLNVIGIDEKFDLIITNPPWGEGTMGGRLGKAFSDPGQKFLRYLLEDVAPAALKPGGEVVIGYSSRNDYGERSIFDLIQSLSETVGYEWEVIGSLEATRPLYSEIFYTIRLRPASAIHVEQPREQSRTAQTPKAKEMQRLQEALQRDYAAVLLDVDGTLNTFSRETPPEIIGRIVDLMTFGRDVVIATGRRYEGEKGKDIRSIVDSIRNEITRRGLSVSLMERLFAAPEYGSYIYDTLNDMVIRRYGDARSTFSEETKKGILNAIEAYASEKNLKFTVKENGFILSVSFNAEIRKGDLHETISSVCRENGYDLNMYCTWTGAEFVPASIDKYNAISFLREHAGIDEHKIAAIGDLGDVWGNDFAITSREGGFTVEFGASEERKGQVNVPLATNLKNDRATKYLLDNLAGKAADDARVTDASTGKPSVQTVSAFAGPVLQPKKFISDVASMAQEISLPESYAWLGNLHDKTLLSVSAALTPADIRSAFALAKKKMNVVMVSGCDGNSVTVQNGRMLETVAFDKAVSSGQLVRVKDITMPVEGVGVGIYLSSYRDGEGNTAAALIAHPADIARASAKAGVSKGRILSEFAWQVQRELLFQQGNTALVRQLLECGLPVPVIDPAAVQVNDAGIYNDYVENMDARSHGDAFSTSDSRQLLNTTVYVFDSFRAGQGSSRELRGLLPGFIVGLAKDVPEEYAAIVKETATGSDGYIQELQQQHALQVALFGRDTRRENGAGYSFMEQKQIASADLSVLVDEHGVKPQFDAIAYSAQKQGNMYGMLLSGAFDAWNTLKVSGLDVRKALGSFDLQDDHELEGILEAYERQGGEAVWDRFVTLFREKALTKGNTLKEYRALQAVTGLSENEAFLQLAALRQIAEEVKKARIADRRILLQYPFVGAAGFNASYLAVMGMITGIDGVEFSLDAGVTAAVLMDARRAMRSANPDAILIEPADTAVLCPDEGVIREVAFDHARPLQRGGTQTGCVRIASQQLLHLPETEREEATNRLIQSGYAWLIVVISDLNAVELTPLQTLLAKLKLRTRPGDLNSSFDEGAALSRGITFGQSNADILAGLHELQEIGIRYLNQGGKERDFIEEVKEVLPQLEKAAGGNKLNRNAVRYVASYIGRVESRIPSRDDLRTLTGERRAELQLLKVQYLGCMQALRERLHRGDASDIRDEIQPVYAKLAAARSTNPDTTAALWKNLEKYRELYANGHFDAARTILLQEFSGGTFAQEDFHRIVENNNGEKAAEKLIDAMESMLRNRTKTSATLAWLPHYVAFKQLVTAGSMRRISAEELRSEIESNIRLNEDIIYAINHKGYLTEEGKAMAVLPGIFRDGPIVIEAVVKLLELLESEEKFSFDEGIGGALINLNTVRAALASL